MPQADEAKYRSPLHPHALTRREITPGMHVIRFNKALGVIGEFEVLSKPFYEKVEKGEKPSMMIRIRNLRHGFETDHSLADMGVVPYSQPNGWNSVNFTIDVAMRETLPEPDAALAEQRRKEMEFDHYGY